MRLWQLPFLFLLVAGCGQGDKPNPVGGGATLDRSKYVAASEPAGARGVVEVRKEAKDGDEVVVVGRIGGSKTPFTGRAAFTIVDPSLKCCDDKGEQGETPWDFA